MLLKGVGKEGGFQALIVPHSTSPVALIYVLSQVLSGYNYEVSLCTDPTRSGDSPLMGKVCGAQPRKMLQGDTLPSYSKSSLENSHHPPKWHLTLDLAPFLYKRLHSFKIV